MDIEIFPTGGDLTVLPPKIIFPHSITKDVLHKEKVDNCYRSTTWHVLAKNCPKAASTKADVTGSEQHEPPRDLASTPPQPPPPHTPLIRTPSPNEAFTDVDKHQEIPWNQENAESQDLNSEYLGEGEVEKESEMDLQEFSKNSSPQKLNSQPPGEEEENENVGNLFSEIIVGNPKRLNGCKLVEQAFPI